MCATARTNCWARCALAKKDIHVVPHKDGGWATRREGASRVGTRTNTQREAQDVARRHVGERSSGFGTVWTTVNVDL